MIGMRSDLAFSNLDPAPATTTRAVVFLEALSATCPPAASISSAAFARESDGRVPVTTYVCPASGPFPSVTVGSVKFSPSFSRRSSSLRFLVSSKNPATASAIAIPTPRILLISSTEALRSAFMVPKWRAGSCAPCAPPRRETEGVREGGEGAALAHRSEHLRDYLAGTRDFHPIALANVLRFDQVEVVERGGGDCDTPDFHGLEHGIRVECAGASDIDPDLLELGDLDLGRELAGDGPTRLAIPHRAQLDVQLERVDLHHDAVGAIVERGEELFELGDLRVGVREVGDEGVVRFDREPPRGELLEQLVLRRDGQLLAGRFDVEAEDPQATAARDLGVELAQRARGGVARVGEGGLARLLALAVELYEAGLGEIDLARHLHQPGPALSREPQRPVHHGPQVGRDVFADQAVPTRRADDEEPLLVRETHRGAVDLYFERIAGVATLRDEPGVAVFPFGELRLVEHVRERQHRYEVAVLLERRRGLHADALCGAVGGAQLGMLGLELLQLAEQAVVLGVGHLPRVQCVIGVVGALDEPPQLGGSGGRTLHRPLASS